jgi:hypothetical protein
MMEHVWSRFIRCVRKLKLKDYVTLAILARQVIALVRTLTGNS